MSALIDDAAREWIGRAAPARRIEVTRNEIVKYSIATARRGKSPPDPRLRRVEATV